MSPPYQCLEQAAQDEVASESSIGCLLGDRASRRCYSTALLKGGVANFCTPHGLALGGIGLAVGTTGYWNGSRHVSPATLALTTR